MPDAARGSVSALVSAAGGHALNPERLTEFVGSGALCHPAPLRTR
jgi:hypothetical protein